ncbi:MAG TPA: response regulator, partial [Polyangia bacterium]
PAGGGARLAVALGRDEDHELRVRRDASLGITELLLATGLTPAQQRLARALRSAVADMGDIVADPLGRDGGGAAGFRPAIVELDVERLVAATMELFADRARRRRVELAWDTRGPGIMRGCAQRLRRVLANLIDAALDHAEGGELLVEVDDVTPTKRAALRAPGAVRLLRFTVSTTGDPHRAPAAELHADDGDHAAPAGPVPGPALARARVLAEAIGGAVDIQWRAGGGAALAFFAPLERCGAPEQRGELAATRILVVDESVALRRVVCRWLAGWGLDPGSAGSSAPALEMLRAAAAEGAPYGVIIAGVEPSEAAAREVARALAADPGLAAQVVLLAPFGGTVDRAVAERAGAAAVLSKPLGRAELRRCLLGLGAPRERDDRVATEPTRFNLRVLLVEDDAVGGDTARGMLESFGCQVQVAPDTRTALTLATAVHHDVVLMSWDMPHVDTLEASARLRSVGAPPPARGPAGGRRGRTPIYALVNDTGPVQPDRCVPVGVDGCLSKPLRRAQVRTVLQGLVADPRQTA